MASAIFKPSRIISVLILLGAAGWIASGVFSPSAHEGEPEATPRRRDPLVPVQKVDGRRRPRPKSTSATSPSPAPPRPITARSPWRAANGVIIELKVERGDLVSAGQTIATLSDEGRQSAVLQAQALLDQRIAEYDANKALIDKGQAPEEPAHRARSRGRRGARGACRGAGRGRPVDHPLADRRPDRDRARCRSARPSSPAPRSPRSSTPIRCSRSAR